MGPGQKIPGRSAARQIYVHHRTCIWCQRTGPQRLSLGHPQLKCPTPAPRMPPAWEGRGSPSRPELSAALCLLWGCPWVSALVHVSLFRALFWLSVHVPCGLEAFLPGRHLALSPASVGACPCALGICHRGGEGGDPETRADGSSWRQRPRGRGGEGWGGTDRESFTDLILHTQLTGKRRHMPRTPAGRPRSKQPSPADSIGGNTVGLWPNPTAAPPSGA